MLKLFTHRLPIALLLVFSHQLIAEELLIIIAKDSPVTQMNNRQLERIYRRKTQINKQGERWVPINLAIEHPIRQAFSERLFKQRPE